ncbi:PREDICTED: probable receptor-like protein kinase At3g17420 isoform X2 [Theobroma cacao]|uniref:Probable receptor-like protein kinase At3g17420 isoform X2 n=1 Tax=Theobroma cacao TaxID=3641 RepID=A0AB32W8R9_THECC|nr:PREDICTED: probable receptor-like protein kinase At3g17420 isoform X2 [Theobroma cacao]
MYMCNWHWNKHSKPVPVFCIFVLITSAQVTVSQPSTTKCSLEFESTASPSSSCEGGDWGGFLNKNCCGAAFPGYLDALGKRANITGLIFLSYSEQTSCLASMKRFEGNVFICGIEKLTRGAGGCSDYSVADVANKLGDELRSFSEKCKFFSSGGFDESCDSCVRSWKDIGGTQSKSTDAESIICRFAVLVSLTSSKIGDENIERIYECLSRKTSSYAENIEESTPEDKKKTKVKTASKDVLLKKSGCPKFRIKEVYSATNSLDESNFIGEGTAGKVYKGILSNQQPVAVKHIINDGNVETFVREVTSVSHIKHPNLVTLLGYCLSGEECFLIYELCPNGNLAEWLFGKDKVLSWIQRLEIAIGSARGLWFLHTYSEGCIVHRDIKPTNILLGPNFEAKLSDFGLSKLIDLGETNVSSEVRGTFGYVDPEYQNNRQVNSSGDVYSYGIVLLQILSGKKVFNLNLKKPMALNKMARVLSRGGGVKEFADSKLEGEYSVEAFDLTFQLALSCTSVKQQRPSMEQVVANLEKALDISTRERASTPEATPDRRSTT